MNNKHINIDNIKILDKSIKDELIIKKEFLYLPFEKGMKIKNNINKEVYEVINIDDDKIKIGRAHV